MQCEYEALVKNGTWELVPPSPSQNRIGCKWIFHIKRNPDGSVSRYKARLVVKGYNQRPGIDYSDMFSLVVKPVIVRTILCIASSQNWKLRQMYVNNEFLNSAIQEEVFMAQPLGFVDSSNPSLVYRL